MQCKDIPDELIIAVIEWNRITDQRTSTNRIQELLPMIPPKVVDAKLNKLEQRGILLGQSTWPSWWTVVRE